MSFTHTHTKSDHKLYLVSTKCPLCTVQKEFTASTKKAKLKMETNKIKNTKNTNNCYTAGKEKEASSR